MKWGWVWPAQNSGAHKPERPLPSLPAHSSPCHRCRVSSHMPAHPTFLSLPTPVPQPACLYFPTPSKHIPPPNLHCPAVCVP